MILDIGVIIGSASSVNPLVAMPDVNFHTPEEACSFVLRWDGQSAEALLAAIRKTREHGTRTLHDSVVRRIARMPFEFPRPKDIPIFLESPIWAVDAEGNALVGMPGHERVEPIELIRQRMLAANEHPRSFGENAVA
jgi:hypothetical protein